jgi:hypothetical protein
MSIKNGAVIGAAIGTGLAVIMIALDQLRMFSIPVNDFIDRVIFRVCPLYILGFSAAVPNKAVWFLLTVMGNMVIYGMVGAVLSVFARKKHA